MNKRILMLGLIMLLGLMIPVVYSIDDEHEHIQKGEKEIHLSKELKKTLSKEMYFIQNTMKKLIPALASGEWDKIAESAEKLKSSYIMKQNLTKNQIKELHLSLPEGFQELDHDYHETAGRLAHAAAKHDGQLVSFYYCKLLESCVKCHSAYARNKFPNFHKPHRIGEHH